MLGYLVEPFIQIQNVNGTPISGAKIYVYNADTSDLANTYNDFEGHFNTNPVITDELGNATIIADDGIEYDISVHDENDLLLFTKKHVSIDKTSASGGNTQIVPGYGITVSRVGNTFTVSVDTDLIATQDDLADKQDKLTAGDNISISDDNVISVVNRREVVAEWPIKLERGNNRVKFYLDNDYANQFKSKQTPVEYGNEAGKYISYISQNANGVITATVVDDWSIGVDLKLANNVLSIDTDSTETGSMNFVAGHSNSVTGDYCAAFGSGNTVDGDICFVAGENHSVTGDGNFVFGRNSLVTGNNNLVYGVSTTETGTGVTGDNNIVLGDSGINVGFKGANIVAIGRLQYGVDNAGSGLINNSTFVGTNNYSYTQSTTASDVTGFTFIGYNNGFSQRKGHDYAITMIGQENDILGSLDSTTYSYATTIIGYQNNSWSTSALQNVTLIGSNNGISQYGSTYHGAVSDLSILGYRNEYLVDATDGQTTHYNSLILGNDNSVTAKTNYKTLAIGFDNTLTGNCTYLIGSNLTATNEGSYSAPIMKIGFGNTYLKITPTGISKVINGTETPL